MTRKSPQILDDSEIVHLSKKLQEKKNAASFCNALYSVAVVRAMLRLADAYLRKNLLDAALRNYGDILAASSSQPDSNRIPDSLIARAYYGIGIVHERRRQLECARCAFEASLRLRSMNPSACSIDEADIRHQLGKILRKMGEHNEAMECFCAALRIRMVVLGRHHPLVAETLSQVGGLHLDRKEFEEARLVFDEVVRLRMILEESVKNEDTCNLTSFSADSDGRVQGVYGPYPAAAA